MYWNVYSNGVFNVCNRLTLTWDVLKWKREERTWRTEVD